MSIFLCARSSLELVEHAVNIASDRLHVTTFRNSELRRVFAAVVAAIEQRYELHEVGRSFLDPQFEIGNSVPGMRQGIDEQILILRKLGHRGGPPSLDCIAGTRDGPCIDLALALQVFSGLDKSLNPSNG